MSSPVVPTKTSLPAEAKERIIKHMNSEHQDSLVMYLEQHASLSSFAARNARLVDVSLTGMSISAGPGSAVQHTIPFSPPLSSAAELRPRVVSMDQEARAKLGRSPVTVRKFTYPRGIGLFFAVFCLYALISSAVPTVFLPGGLLWEAGMKHAPALAQLSYDVAFYVFWGSLAAHGAEALFILRPKLAKHNVPVGSGVWIKWMLSDFLVDGYSTIFRFDQLVREEKAKLDAKKH